MRNGTCKPRTLFKSLVFEHLEDRAMMAGNVCCACTNGCLSICGDKCDNSICVRQCQDGKIEVRGLNGTKINGCECWSCCEVCCMKIDLKQGCDCIKVTDCCLRGCICICDSLGGNENVNVTKSDIGGLSINTGKGCDCVRVSCCKICCAPSCWGQKDASGGKFGCCCIDTGCGNDCLVCERICGWNCSLEAKTGDGNDCCFISKCETRQICCDSGKGTDTLAVTRCCADKCDVKCSKTTRVCCENNNCQPTCSKARAAQLADCVHEVTKCRDWCSWECNQADLV